MIDRDIPAWQIAASIIVAYLAHNAAKRGKSTFDMAVTDHDEAADDLQKSEAVEARDMDRGRAGAKLEPMGSVASASSDH